MRIVRAGVPGLYRWTAKYFKISKFQDLPRSRCSRRAHVAHVFDLVHDIIPRDATRCDAM